MSHQRLHDTQPPVDRGADVQDVVEGLLDSYENGAKELQHVNSYELPSRERVIEAVDRCRALVFPGYVGGSMSRVTKTELREILRERVDEARNLLRRQLYRGIHHKVQLSQGTSEMECPDCAAVADKITLAFLAQLPALRELVATDIRAAFAGDPAATGYDEIIFCYPGVYAISVYRMAHALHGLGAKVVPRMMTEHAHEKTGIDIHPAARIGHSFFIDHGTGVVIGETAEIGHSVKLYQGVTLGALSPSQNRDKICGTKRHPTIGDNVVIYSGATILGGDTTVGAGSVVGANCWITASVPENGRVKTSVLR